MARPVDRLDDDGDGRSHVEAESTGPADARSWYSTEIVDAPNLDGFRRHTLLHWTGTDTVHLSTSPRCLPTDPGSSIVLDLTATATATATATLPMTAAPLPLY